MFAGIFVEKMNGQIMNSKVYIFKYFETEYCICILQCMICVVGFLQAHLAFAALRDRKAVGKVMIVMDSPVKSRL
jgi:hypothetical protein